jgi:hypothetical protein
MSEQEALKFYISANFAAPNVSGFYDGGAWIHTNIQEIDLKMYTTGLVCNSCGIPIWICDCIEKGQFHPMKTNILIEKQPFGTPEDYRKYLSLYRDTCKCSYRKCSEKGTLAFEHREGIFILGRPFCKSTIPKDKDEFVEVIYKRFETLKKAGFHPLYNYCQLQDQVKILTQEVETLKKALADTLAALATK